MKRPVASFVVAGALALGVAPSLAHAEPAPRPADTAWLRKAPPKPAPKVETKPALSPFRVGAMLTLVAALGGVAFYARRKRAGLPGKKSENARLNVLSSTRLGPKAHAVVSEVAGKRLLLGVTHQSVSVLAWLDSESAHIETPEVEIAEPAELSGIVGPADFADPGDASHNPTGFLRVLRNAVGSRAATPAEEVVRATQDEVKISRRAMTEARELVEGQAAGILRRKRASK
ncbi:MAG TPA: flagellar biosynthetic protein FliO [Polyangiaceae bacterium]